MRRYEQSRQLRPWARRTKDAILATGAGILAIGASYGSYLFLTTLQGIANQQPQGVIPGFFGSLGFIGFLALAMWVVVLAASREKLMPLLLGLDVSGLIVLNLLYQGLFQQIVSALGIVLFWAILFGVDKVRDAIYKK